MSLDRDKALSLIELNVPARFEAKCSSQISARQFDDDEEFSDVAFSVMIDPCAR